MSQVCLDAMKDKEEASGEQEEDEKEPVIHVAASPPPHWVSVCCLSRVLQLVWRRPEIDRGDQLWGTTATLTPPPFPHLSTRLELLKQMPKNPEILQVITRSLAQQHKQSAG